MHFECKNKHARTCFAASFISSTAHVHTFSHWAGLFFPGWSELAKFSGTWTSLAVDHLFHVSHAVSWVFWIIALTLASQSQPSNDKTRKCNVLVCLILLCFVFRFFNLIRKQDKKQIGKGSQLTKVTFVVSTTSPTKAATSLKEEHWSLAACTASTIGTCANLETSVSRKSSKIVPEPNPTRIQRAHLEHKQQKVDAKLSNLIQPLIPSPLFTWYIRIYKNNSVDLCVYTVYMRIIAFLAFVASLNLPGTTRWLRCPIATVLLWSAQTIAGHWDNGIKTLRCKTAKLKCTKTTHTIPQTLRCNQHICNRLLPTVGKTCASAKAFLRAFFISLKRKHDEQNVSTSKMEIPVPVCMYVLKIWRFPGAIRVPHCYDSAGAVPRC